MTNQGVSHPIAVNLLTGALTFDPDLSATYAPILSDRGNWAATTAYAVSDAVTQAGQRYVCKTAHTSGGSFSTTNWVSVDSTPIPALDSGTAGPYRANMRRSEANSSLTALTSGVMTSVLIYLEAGDVVTNLSFFSGATGAVVPLSWWFALYSTAATPALLAQTADQATTAWAANSVKTVPLAAPYTVTATGLHYASVMVAATTPPLLTGVSMGIAGIGAALISGQKGLALTSGAALTTTAPSTITSATASASLPLAIAT